MSFKIKTLSMIAATAAISLASCSSEEPLGNNNDGQVYEGIGYMSFSIANPADGTRAGEFTPGAGDEQSTDENGKLDEWFNNGSANEYAVCPNKDANVAFYFDKDGVFWGMSTLQPFNSNATAAPGEPDGHPAHNTYAEKYYTYVTRWRNDDSAAEKPSQVIVVLNADPDKLSTIANARPTVETLTYHIENVFKGKAYVYGSYQYAGNKYFTMTNSSFRDENANVDNTVTQITPDQICETAELALQHPVTVYVERLLAKFELNHDDVYYPFAANSGVEKEMATIKFV